MEFSIYIIFFIIAMQFIAALMKSLVGFGNSEISLPTLSLAMNSSLVTSANALVDIPLNTTIAVREKKSYSIRKYLPLIIVNSCGSLLGAYFLKVSPPAALKIAVGIFIMIIGLNMLLNKKQDNARPYGPFASFSVCFLSGISGGIFGINLFFLPIFKKMADSYSEFKGSICFVFTVNALLRIPIYIAMGVFTADVLWIFLFSMIGICAGLFIGSVLEKYIHGKAVNLLATLLLICAGASLLIKTVLEIAG